MIRQTVDSYFAKGQRHAISVWSTYLADALQLAGQTSEAFATFQRALEVHPNEIACRPETYRLRGELHLRMGQPHLAEADFREAIALASSIGAKAWQLRATISLARLLTAQGGGEEAKTMLAEIYGSFTEGLDTADLKEAKALLNRIEAVNSGPIHFKLRAAE